MHRRGSGRCRFVRRDLPRSVGKSKHVAELLRNHSGRLLGGFCRDPIREDSNCQLRTVNVPLIQVLGKPLVRPVRLETDLCFDWIRVKVPDSLT
jgi:hypothetical protein